MKRYRRAREDGVAIIMALLTTTLATVLAASVIGGAGLAVDSLQGRRDHAQALQLALGGVDYARAVLAEDARRTSYDHAAETWSTPLPAYDTGHGVISGRIEERQGCWSINNLAPKGETDVQALQVFRRLLLLLDLPQELADNAAFHIADPVDSPAASALQGWYAQQLPPRLPAHRPLADFSELRMIRGFDAAVTKILSPYVCVLPVFAAVNVNTASAVVLAAVVADLDLAAAQRVVGERAVAPFRDLADFANRARVNIGSDRKALDVSSRFFVVHASAFLGQATVNVDALLHRRPGDVWPAVLWRARR